MKKLMLALMAGSLCLCFTGCSKSMDDNGNGKDSKCDTDEDCECKDNCKCRHGKWGKDAPGAEAKYK